jgi:uncharacterized protein (TIGR02246 family)
MAILLQCHRATRLGALGFLACMALAFIPSVPAQGVTAQTLVERAQIQDLITHYYYNFGREDPESFAEFYTDDAELILGATHFKGREGITKAYARAGKDSPMRKAYSFNVTISNPLITVHGDTATSQLIFTEYLILKQGDAPTIRTQGREYATFVKAHGHWRYRTRQIMGGMQSPADWKE